LERRTGEPLRRPDADFVSRIQKSESVISGRFHGTCLAFLLLKPVASIPSNTHKIEGLYHDIGLDCSLLKSRGFLKWIGESFIQKQWDHVSEHMNAVSKYVQTAPTKIESMFNQIASL
jgi:polysaccharide pyruvyl transferase WcaK-like protein